MVDPGESLVGASSAPVRKLAIVAALIGVAGAAWWMFGRGKGQPEDPARVLIVGPTPELAEFLDHEGFDPLHLSFGAAVGEGKAHDPSLDDVAAVIEHADQQGIGYVAFDLVHGQTYDFAGAGYEVGEPPPGSTFVVLAVGKLGDQVSFGGVVPGIHHEPPADEKVGLLLALFGQDALAKARTNEATNDLMIRFGAQRTIEELVAYEKAQTNMRRQIAAWEALPERERGETKPIELARSYERLRGWPLANGKLLLASGRGAWHSDDGLDSEWTGEGLTAEFSLASIDALDRRGPCPTLPDTLALDGGFALGPGGDVLLIPSDRWVADLWVLGGVLGDADEGCGFEQRNPIRRLANGELGKPRANGRTAEALDGALMWADAKMQAYRTLRLPGVTLHERALVWLSDDVVAIPASLDFVEAASARAARMAQAADPTAPIPEPAAIDPSALPGKQDALVLIRLPAAKQDDVVEVALVSVGVGQSTIAITPLTTGTSAIVQLDGPEGAALDRVALSLAGPAWSNALDPGFDLADAVERGASEFERVASLPEDILDLAICRRAPTPLGPHSSMIRRARTRCAPTRSCCSRSAARPSGRLGTILPICVRASSASRASW
ncbi:hypothetical protein ACNOYE_30835 [Nannocystaceae bacterium ST9]